MLPLGPVQCSVKKPKRPPPLLRRGPSHQTSHRVQPFSIYREHYEAPYEAPIQNFGTEYSIEQVEPVESFEHPLSPEP